MNVSTSGLHRGGLIKFKSVRAKLLSAFAVVTVLTLVLGVVGLQQQGKIFDEVKTARNVSYDSAAHVAQMEKGVMFVRLDTAKLPVAGEMTSSRTAALVV